MSYCYFCLERTDECKCDECAGDLCEQQNTVYGDNRRAYLEGYRDAKAGKEENL